MNNNENKLVREELIPLFEKIAGNTISSYGYDLYFVGGMVRDSILYPEKISDGDIDMSGALTPEEFIEILNKLEKEKFITKLGASITKKVGTVFTSMLFNGLDVELEYTPFRIESDYSNETKGRQPGEVSFSRNIEDDYQRRDFSMNALYYSISKNEIIDLGGGVNDIKNKQIKCIGNANERFEEDYLRILRALRFSAKFGFSIEENTYTSMIKLVTGLNNISIFRITEEFGKGFSASKWEYVKILEKFGNDVQQANKRIDMTYFLNSVSFNGLINNSCLDPIICGYLFSKKDKNSFIFLDKFDKIVELSIGKESKYYETAVNILTLTDKGFEKINTIKNIDDFHKYLYSTAKYHFNIDEYITIFKIVKMIDEKKDFVKYAEQIKLEGRVYDLTFVPDKEKQPIIDFIQKQKQENNMNNIKEIVFEKFFKV